MLIKINNTWVNPRYVTAIKELPRSSDLTNEAGIKYMSEVWVVGNAGYNTFNVYSCMPAKEIAIKLNELTDE